VYLGTIEDIAGRIILPGRIVRLDGWQHNPQYTPSFMEALESSLAMKIKPPNKEEDAMGKILINRTYTEPEIEVEVGPPYDAYVVTSLASTTLPPGVTVAVGDVLVPLGNGLCLNATRQQAFELVAGGTKIKVRRDPTIESVTILFDRLKGGSEHHGT